MQIKCTDPVVQQVCQVVDQAFQENRERNISPKTFLRRAEKAKKNLANSLPPSQISLCNEIVTVILMNYESVPRVMSEERPGAAKM